MADMLLHRFTVRPRHLPAYLQVWPDEVVLRRRHGFTVHQAYLETDAEPKLTWLYSHPEPDAGLAALAADPTSSGLAERAAPHVFGNAVLRPVRVELLDDAHFAAILAYAEPPTGGTGTARTVIMRRYSIVGAWDEFLDLWRRIVIVRRRHGFRCLFAVADEPHDLFTWAFDFAGSWADFAAAQRPYYHDPERVQLRQVFDYMADYAIHPARAVDPSG